MRLEQSTRHRRHPSLTSLIDVIFLLLLFFMLSSTFNKYSQVEISSSKTGGVNSDTRVELFITLSTDGWKINGDAKANSKIANTLITLSSQGKKKAVLQVSNTLNAQEMVKAVELLQEADINVTVIR